MPPKGSKKRARSSNEDGSPDALPIKKQRVGEAIDDSSPGGIVVNTNGPNAASPDNEDLASARRSAPARIRKPAQRYALEDSLAARPSRARNAQKQNGEIASKPKTQPKDKAQDPVPNPDSSIYEVPDSGDELDGGIKTQVLVANKKKGSLAPEASKSVSPAPAAADEPVKRKRGRPRKDQSALNGSQRIKASSTITASKAQPTKSRAVRGAGKDDEDTSTVKVSKVRGRKDLIVDAQKQPKGILTPSKRNGGRGLKSVAFSGMNGEKDADDAAPESPSTSIRRNKKSQPIVSPEVDSEAESEDEEVCTVCSKPDSKRGNEIIFCDNCDMAVHQKCYNVKDIPEGDWFCRNCSQDNVESTDQVEESVAAVVDEIPEIPNLGEHLGGMQRVLIDRCTGRRRIKLRGLDDVYEKAFQLVEQTIVAGEGNSMLVIGARGCGKTTLIETVVSDVSKQYKGQFHVVRLNGFIHTDDKLALREIWRQLGKEMEVEDDLISKTNNYADTMASLLALLSHPSEIAADAQDGVTSKSVIFVMDEFDLFATHARQTLLYNLFDIAQAKKAPIAVLGLTTRIDVVESLEKRVKSRFSHRYVYLSLPKSLPAFWDICRQGLSIDDEDMKSEGIDLELKGHSQFWKWWNEKIEALYKTRTFLDRLESHFYTTKSVTAFLRTCILPLSSLTPTSPTLQIPDMNPPLDPVDSKLHLLESLSDLDLSMLIAAARLDIVAHTDTVNFAMAYDEYASLMGRQRVQSASSGMLAMGGGARVWGRGVAGIAWERLVTLGLLVPAAPGARVTAVVQTQGGLDRKMWKVDVALEEIPGAVKLNGVLGRWCREI